MESVSRVFLCGIDKLCSYTSVGDEAYPVLQTIKDLTHIIATYPRLAKDGTSALVDLGAAIKDVAPPAEIRELVLGTLSKDSNVRNAALQALQVGPRLLGRAELG